MNNFIYTVTQLNNHAKSILENNINNVWLKGEISSFKKYTSGHAYFTLKDEKAEISCTIFNYNDSLNFIDGINITINGDVSIYANKGKFQIIVKDSYVDGDGKIFVDLNKLKNKLFNEGLFDKSSKKKLPFFPINIGIITSLDGAVYKDLINILNRRSPYLNIFVINTLVQGKTAPNMLIDSIKKLNTVYNIDAIIIARGGGSYEDLMCFNDEMLVREIFKAKVPIISAIGHETDFTLCDLVADVRVSTPSEAAEIVAPSIQDLFQIIDSKLLDIKTIVESSIIDSDLNLFRFKMKNLSERKIDFLNHKILYLSSVMDKIELYSKNKIKTYFLKIDVIKKTLKKNNINYLKKIGFSIVTKKNKIIISQNQLSINDNILIELNNGKIKAIVKEIYEKK